MLQRSRIFPSLIGFLLLNLQVFKTSFTLNMIEFPEINYLASKLTPSECFQLYNVSRGRHLKVETLNFIQRKSYTIPCVTLLSTWLTDIDELNLTNIDNVNLKLKEIGREDLSLQLNRNLLYRRNKTDSSGAKDLETERNYCGNEENEEEYCLCTDKLKETSFEDYCTNKKESSNFQKVTNFFKEYFNNRNEKKKEKLRYQRFQKLKKKLQKMYLEQRKEIRVNRQEEKILNSLTEKERDELGETICEMRFFLDSDKETEKLLLSGKRSGTFIIDMKNLHRPKITHSHVTSQGSKNCESREKFSNLSIVSPPKTCSECEIAKNDREKKNCRKTKNRRRDLKNERGTKNSKLIELEETSEFIKYYTISESEQCSSPIMKRDERYESDQKTNFSTSDGSEMQMFCCEKYQKSNKIQSDIDSRKKNSTNIIKSKSMIELEFTKLNKLSIEKENSKTNNINQSDFINKTLSELKKINSNSLSIAACKSRRNFEKSNENLQIFENLERGDTESQLDFRKTCDELSLLVSQQMKYQSYPCQRKYCLLRRHLRQRSHDLKQCQFKNYFQYYLNDDAPSCGASRICRDTYDEFKMMRATPREKKRIRESIYKRRKEFLDQPCFSPKKKCLNSPIGIM
ncbi:uncharacterized protein LOC127288664 isoform X2 [Leptopilina boulardi]|uniref:uncharacterized protein LOC127288664 isoform X2 n=1 Tax=Leptopilina boulardi TaxID=63433 RepID=UPI0021F69999|nr:uncharacterized protein LOC127288664 isoform X2 [Leptopilina boulardi]